MTLTKTTILLGILITLSPLVTNAQQQPDPAVSRQMEENSPPHNPEESKPVPAWEVSGQLQFLTEYVGSGGYHYSRGRPVVQGVVDVAHKSGFWGELWTSSVAEAGDDGGVSNTAGMEIDIFLGYDGKITESISWFAIYGYYYFPKNTHEHSDQKGSQDLEVGVKWKFLPSSSFLLSVTRDLDFDFDLIHGKKNGDNPGTTLSTALSHNFGDGWTARAGVSYYRPDGYDHTKGMKDKLRWYVRGKKTFGGGKYFVDVRYVDTDRNEDAYGPALVGTFGINF
ncbi:MAG: hypothetical protein LBG69_05100 [Zoogloeaceae bacterium]|nr:hypothetical protein [Zoogloeaceae bacterium]